MKITGIVLAGGKSSRMGRAKCLLPIRENYLMIQAVIDILKQAGAQDIIISSNNPNLRNLNYKVVPDLLPGHGPLAGIVSALYESDTEVNLIAPCDTPWIIPELYVFLLQNLEDSQAVVPVDSQRVYPLNIVIRKSATEKLHQALKAKILKVQKALRMVKTRYVPLGNQSFYSPQILQNINTPRDYQDLIVGSL